jgi:hypothetical protein
LLESFFYKLVQVLAKQACSKIKRSFIQQRQIDWQVADKLLITKVKKLYKQFDFLIIQICLKLNYKKSKLLIKKMCTN